MRTVKLPIIGQVQIGKTEPTPVVPAPAKTKGFTGAQLGAGFLDLSDLGLGTNTTVSDRLLKAYEGWVYANVSVLAEEVSKIEFELYTTKYVKGELEFTDVTTHPVLDLLDRFNPFTTTSEGIYTTEAHIELAGDTFYLLDNAVNPTNIFILQPDKVEVVPGNAANGYQIKQYKYKFINDKGQTEEKVYAPENVIQFKNPDPSNPLRGKSVVAAAAKVIDLDNLTEEFLKNYFKNNATPGMTLSSDQRVTKDDIARIQAELKRGYAGPKNQWKTLILGGGLKPVTVQSTLRDMLMLELEDHMRDKIMALFKNTKASLGIVEDVNRANAESTILSWKQSVIKPKMQRLCDTLNEFLVPRFGDNLILGFKDPVPEDKAAKIDEATKLKTGDIITLNEARDLLDYDPVGGGDEFGFQRDERQMAEQAKLAAAAAAARPPVPKALLNISLDKTLRRMGVPQEVIRQRHIYRDARELARKALEARKKPVKGKTAQPEDKRLYRHLSNADAKAYWAKQIKLTEMVEQKFKDRLDGFLLALEEKAIGNLHQAVPKGITKKTKAFELFDPEAEVQAGIDLFTPLQQEIAALSAAEAYIILHLDSVYNPSKTLVATITEAVKLFTKSFIDTDRAELTAILSNGIQDGSSVPQIESAIREKFGQYRQMQSERIARTETLRASNAGALDAYKQSGVVTGKQWLTAGATDECETYNGMIEWDLDGNFYSVTNDFADGDPPLHPNCRCVLLPVVETADAAVTLQAQLDANRDYIAELEKIAGVA